MFANLRLSVPIILAIMIAFFLYKFNFQLILGEFEDILGSNSILLFP